MEHVSIQLNNITEFDRILKHSLPEQADIKFITKDKATQRGNPGVMISFSVVLPEGSITTVQAVTTVKNFLMAARAMEARYPGLMDQPG